MDGPKEGTSLVARAWQPSSCLENPMDKGAWQTIVHGVTKSRKCLKQLSTHTFTRLREGRTEWGKSDREGEILHDIACMWNLKRSNANELTYKTEKDTDFENELMVAERKGGKG